MHNWFGTWEEDCIKHFAWSFSKLQILCSIKPVSVRYQGVQMATKCAEQKITDVMKPFRRHITDLDIYFKL